jgi:tetratricopeptide (TPR) repeat protein
VVLLAAAGLLGIALLYWARLRWRIPDEVTLAAMRLDRLIALAGGHPESEPVYFVLGLRLQREGRTYEAVSAFDQAAAANPRSPRALEGAARALEQADQPEDAARYFAWCLRLDPGRSAVRQSLGRLYQSHALWAPAAQQFAWLARHQPEDAETWLRLGQCRGQLGRHQEALDALRRAAKLDPARGSIRTALRLEEESPASRGSP